MKKPQQLKVMIESALQNFAETRNSDQLLMETIRKENFGIYPRHGSGSEPCFIIPIGMMRMLPNKDNIKRIRALFNQKGLYISEDPEIRRKRRLSEEKYRDFVQNN